jgi:hypothetical protein
MVSQTFIAATDPTVLSIYFVFYLEKNIYPSKLGRQHRKACTVVRENLLNNQLKSMHL